MDDITFTFYPDGSSEDPEQGLARDLKDAIKKEDYEKAAEIDKELKEIKGSYKTVREPLKKLEIPPIPMPEPYWTKKPKP